MTKLKLFEDFGEEKIFFPWDEDYGYVDLEDPDEFEEFKDNIRFNLKQSSEEILTVIGHDDEKEWFDIINNIFKVKNNDELQECLTDLRDFLNNYSNEQIQKITLILNRQ